MQDWLRAIARRVWLNPALLTILGTLGSLLLSLALYYLLLRGAGSDLGARGIIFAVLVPLLTAAPLFAILGRMVRALSSLKRDYENAVARDSLTSCLNSTLFSSAVDAYPTLTGSREGRRRGAFLVIDVDHLGMINRSVGHRAGDRALRIIAEIIRASVRSDDVVGRLGGGQFGVFLPGATRENAERVAERIRAAVSEARYRPGGRDWRLNVSVGAVLFEQEIEYDRLVLEAELTLQKAKQKGRNRVEYTELRPGFPTSRPSLH